MGNGSSLHKTIFLDIHGKQEKIYFSSHCSSQDVHDLVCQAAGVAKLSNVTLTNCEGAHVSLAPTMPTNTANQPYAVTIGKIIDQVESQALLLTNVLAQVADQFNRQVHDVFKLEEIKSNIENKLNYLETRLQTESMKAIDIEVCKKDIRTIQESIRQQQKHLIHNNKQITNLYNDKGVLLVNDKRGAALYPKYVLTEETIEYLRRPTFDIWHWEPNEMLSLLEHFYVELDLINEFNINPAVLKQWLLVIQANYRNNPFHNFRHCFCVAQMMFGMIHLCKLCDKLSREDLGILITAAICHDLDHPGYNNTYQINARTELAIRYNDISPLENHHCAVAFQILNNPHTNIFGNCSSETFLRIRKGMTMLILATDMARHGEIVENFKQRIMEGFDFSKREHTDTLKMILIKCCDISNEVRPMEVSEPWLDCLLEEYFNQSDREKQEGLPVAPFMDREKVTKPTAQIGFIKFVLIPMFESISKLFSDLETVIVKPLQNTLQHYIKLKEEQDKQKEMESAEKEKN